MVMQERAIETAWLESVLEAPALREPDPEEPRLQRWYRVIPARNGRVLRVVLDPSVEPARVISVFFDRGMRGRL
jgi:hypothetical protein